MEFGKFLKQLTADSAVYALANVSTRLISIILFPLFAKKLSPDQYAVINFLNTVSVLASIVCNLGLDSTTGRWYFDNPSERFRKALFSTWMFSVLASTAMASLIIYTFGYFYMRHSLVFKENIHILLIFTCLNLVLQIAPNVVTTRFILSRKPAHSAVLSVVSGLLSVSLSALFILKLNLGLVGFYGAQTAAFLTISLACVYVYLRKWVAPKYWNRNLFKQMFRYGRSVLIAPVSTQIMLLSTGIFINTHVSQSALGHYQVANTLATCILIITFAFAQGFQPIAIAIRESRQARNNYVILLDIYCFAIGGVTLALSIFYRDIIAWLLPNAFIESAPLAALLSYAAFIGSLNNIASTGMTIVKEVKNFGLIYLYCNLLFIPIIYILTNVAGVIGTCSALLALNSVVVCLLFYFSNRAYSIPYRYASVAATCLTAILIYYYYLAISTSQDTSIIIKIILILVFCIIAIVLLSRYVKKNGVIRSKHVNVL